MCHPCPVQYIAAMTHKAADSVSGCSRKEKPRSGFLEVSNVNWFKQEASSEARQSTQLKNPTRIIRARYKTGELVAAVIAISGVLYYPP